MRYLFVLLPLLAVGCADPYGGGYAYNNGGYAYNNGGYAYNNGGYAYNNGGYAPRYASAYGYNDNSNARPSQYYGGENCGTPDDPKACPPMPRRPLPYYPGDRY